MGFARFKYAFGVEAPDVVLAHDRNLGILVEKRVQPLLVRVNLSDTRRVRKEPVHFACNEMLSMAIRGEPDHDQPHKRNHEVGREDSLAKVGIARRNEPEKAAVDGVLRVNSLVANAIEDLLPARGVVQICRRESGAIVVEEVLAERLPLLGGIAEIEADVLVLAAALSGPLDSLHQRRASIRDSRPGPPVEQELIQHLLVESALTPHADPVALE